MRSATSYYIIFNLDFDWKLIRRKPVVSWPGLVRRRSRDGAVT